MRKMTYTERARLERLAVIARVKPFLKEGCSVDFDPACEKALIIMGAGLPDLVLSASGDDAAFLTISGVDI